MGIVNQPPKEITQAQSTMTRDRFLVRVVRAFVLTSTVPALITTFAMAILGFCTGFALGYVPLADWSEPIAGVAGFCLASSLCFMAIVGTVKGFGFLKRVLIQKAEQSADTSQVRLDTLRAKLEQNPHLGDASSGLSLAKDELRGQIAVNPTPNENVVKDITTRVDS